MTAGGHGGSIRDLVTTLARSVMWSLLALCLLLVAPLRADKGAPSMVDDARISYEGTQLLKVTAPTDDKKEALEKLQDMEGVETWLRLATNTSTVDILVKPEISDKVKEFLDSNGLTFDVIIDNLQAAIDTENPSMSPEEMEELEGRKGHRMTWQSYHRLADIHGYLDYLAQTYPQLVSVQTIGSSVERRQLKVLKISSGREGSPAIWIDGGVHAREWISPASVTYIINELTENHDAHGEAVKNVDWYILPVVNPDGYEYSHRTDRLWRKNRQGAGRCTGTDLNRNFGYKWGGAGSSREPCKEIYAGTRPFSEPESAAVSSFIQGIAGSLKGYVSFHSYGQYILHPWGYAKGYPTDYDDLNRVGRQIGNAMYQAGGATYTVGGAAATLYPASGGSDDWAKGVAGIKYTYTIELRDRGFFGFVLPAQYIIPTGREALAAVKEEVKVKEENFVSERQQLSSVRQGQAVERLTERLKDKDEAIVRLQIEVQSLRDKNGALEQRSEELRLSNTSLQAEVEKQKRVPSKVVAPSSKTTPRNQELVHLKEELAMREMESDKLRKELHSTQTALTSATSEINENQLHVGALQTKISDVQASLTKERAQTRSHNLQIEEDKKKIQDLNRQVKEMERILKRNHPNSISALILTANSDGTDPVAAPTPRLKYLENRVQQLEQELAKSETDGQTSIKEIQDKFQAMKVKYEEHTSDLELQLATAKHQAHMLRQAAEKYEARFASEKRMEELPVRDMKQSKKTVVPPMVITVGALSANALAVREDAHLLATIRGLKLELATKDKELAKIKRELDESAKTNRRLQRERERQLGVVTAPPRQPAVRGAVKEEQSSESGQKTNNKAYDPPQYEPSAPEQQEGLKRLDQENGMLRQELVRLEEDYRGLQTKRLQDLNLLQEQHEAEMDRLISDHVARHSNSRIADLQGQLCTQQIIIGHLKEQLKRLDECREETEMLRTERDHLDKSNMELRKKLADLRGIQTPEMVQYEALQEKLSELERRHETREQKLQAMVRDLLRRNAEQRALNGEDSSATTMREKLLDKNRQLCLYRAEIDRILDTLREFNRHKKTGSTVQLAAD